MPRPMLPSCCPHLACTLLKLLRGCWGTVLLGCSPAGGLLGYSPACHARALRRVCACAPAADACCLGSILLAVPVASTGRLPGLAGKVGCDAVGWAAARRGVVPAHPPCLCVHAPHGACVRVCGCAGAPGAPAQNLEARRLVVRNPVVFYQSATQAAGSSNVLHLLRFAPPVKLVQGQVFRVRPRPRACRVPARLHAHGHLARKPSPAAVPAPRAARASL
jgi:hypothetical protein